MAELIYTHEETFAQPFSIERHMKTFINYTEVVIDSNGAVHYAIPSHERRLVKMILEQNPDMCMKDVEDEAERNMSVEGWCEWLMRRSGCICVYTHGYMAPTGYQMTDAQQGKLNELIEAGLTENVNFNLRSE
jgi:hypothetical protein